DLPRSALRVAGTSYYGASDSTRTPGSRPGKLDEGHGSYPGTPDAIRRRRLPAHSQSRNPMRCGGIWSPAQGHRIHLAWRRGLFARKTSGWKGRSQSAMVAFSDCLPGRAGSSIPLSNCGPNREVGKVGAFAEPMGVRVETRA